MKKSLFIFVAIVVAFMLIFTACSENAATPSSDTEATSETSNETSVKTDASYDIKLGCIQPGPEYYYQTLFDRITAGAESVGIEVVTYLSEYSAEKELSNIEDLCSQGVDAIMMFAVSGDSGLVAAEKCEEKNMPLFLVDASANAGDAKPICCIKKDFYESGYCNGEWLAENYDGEMKILEITSTLGANIAEPTSEGFADALASRSDATIVYQAAADWDRSKAMSITEDAISSGLDFNLVFVHNEDMAAGVISALKAADKLGTDVQVVAQNGSPEGLDMIRNGELLSTCATNPATQAGYSLQMLLKYFDGEEVPEVFDNPVYMFDAGNVDDPNLATWDEEWTLKLVQEYLDTK